MEKLDVQCLNNVVIFTPMHQDIYNSMKPCFFHIVEENVFLFNNCITYWREWDGICYGK